MPVATMVVNRALAGEQWAIERLMAHAGSTVAIVAGPIRALYSIAADGRFIGGEGAADLTLTMSPLAVPTLMAHPARWNELVTAEGDATLAATVAELALTLPWFIEREFSRLLGPIMGTRLAGMGGALLAMPAYTSDRVTESVVRYVRDEKAFAAARVEFAQHAGGVNALEGRVDALAARVDALADRAHAHAAGADRAASDVDADATHERLDVVTGSGAV